MPDINRNKIRQMLEYLEDTTEMDYRHVRRLLENPRAILKGGLDTKEERKFGNVIRVSEQKEFFALLAKEAKLSGRARQQFDWAVHPRNIGTTLRRAQEHTKPKPEKKKRGAKRKGRKRRPKRAPRSTWLYSNHVWIVVLTVCR